MLLLTVRFPPRATAERTQPGALSQKLSNVIDRREIDGCRNKSEYPRPKVAFLFLSLFEPFSLLLPSPVFCFLSPIVSLRGSHPIEVQIMIVGRPILLPEILFYISIRPIEETAGSTK